MLSASNAPHAAVRACASPRSSAPRARWPPRRAAGRGGRRGGARARPRRCRRRRGSCRSRTRTPSRPARGPGGAPPSRPSTRDLLGEEPVGGAHERRVVGGDARVGERDRSRAPCPTPATGRPRASASPSRRTVKPSRPSKARAHHRVVDRVAAQVQGHERVDPRRLDPAPASRRPPGGGRSSARRAASAALSQAGRTARVVIDARARDRCRREARPRHESALARRGARPARSSSSRSGSGRTGLVRRDDRERDDGLARPAREVVDVEREPRREEHQLRREARQRRSQGHSPKSASQMWVKTRVALDAAVLADERGRALHVRRVGRVAGEAERDVGLDGRRQVARARRRSSPTCRPSRCCERIHAAAARVCSSRRGCRGTRAAGGPPRPS